LVCSSEEKLGKRVKIKSKRGDKEGVGLLGNDQKKKRRDRSVPGEVRKQIDKEKGEKRGWSQMRNEKNPVRRRQNIGQPKNAKESKQQHHAAKSKRYRQCPIGIGPVIIGARGEKVQM